MSHVTVFHLPVTKYNTIEKLFHTQEFLRLPFHLSHFVTTLLLKLQPNSGCKTLFTSARCSLRIVLGAVSDSHLNWTVDSKAPIAQSIRLPLFGGAIGCLPAHLGRYQGNCSPTCEVKHGLSGNDPRMLVFLVYVRCPSAPERRQTKDLQVCT